MADQNTRAKTAVALHVDAGLGRLTRRGSALLFVPASPAPSTAVDALIASFVHVREILDDNTSDQTIEPGSNIAFAADASIAFAMIDWTALTSPGQGPWSPGSGIRVVVAGDMVIHVGPGGELVSGVAGRITDSLLDLAGAAAATFEPAGARAASAGREPPGDTAAGGGRAATDLIAGTVPADAFRLELSTEASDPLARIGMWTGSEHAVAPPSFDEVSPDDATFPPPSIVSWPADDLDTQVDATVEAPTDADTDSTSRRETPRDAPSTPPHIGLRIPGGAIVALDGVAVVGREPDLAVARVSALATAIRIDAPTTVSRTHVVMSLGSDGISVSLTDCGSRGRTAVLRDGDHDAEAIDAWTTTNVAIGDVVLLGGPTEVAVISIPATSTPANHDSTLPPTIAQPALRPVVMETDVAARFASDSTQ